MDRAHAERFDHEALIAILQRSQPERLAARPFLTPNSAGKDDPDRLVGDPSEREPERGGRGIVQPLNVVDRDDQGPVTGERADPSKQGEADGSLVGWRRSSVFEQQRDRQRPRQRRWKLREDLVRHRSSMSPRPAKDS